MWISDDFESFCLWNHCDIIPLHYLSLPSPEFMHGNCLPIFQGLITLQSPHSPDNSYFKETHLCPLNLTISFYSTYLNSVFYFWPFLLTGVIEAHRNCITESCVRIRVEIFYYIFIILFYYFIVHFVKILLHDNIIYIYLFECLGGVKSKKKKKLSCDILYNGHRVWMG